MTISTAATPSPLPDVVNWGDPASMQMGMSFVITAIKRYINAGSRIVPCNCTFAANKYTLTPLDAHPLIDKYNDFDVFSFVASDNSTGAVTMTVVPDTGTLSTLKAYITNGSAQAGNGDITAGLHYTATFVDSLDSSSGGFVLR